MIPSYFDRGRMGVYGGVSVVLFEHIVFEMLFRNLCCFGINYLDIYL